MHKASLARRGFRTCDLARPAFNKATGLSCVLCIKVVYPWSSKTNGLTVIFTYARGLHTIFLLFI